MENTSDQATSNRRVVAGFIAVSLAYLVGFAAVLIDRVNGGASDDGWEESVAIQAGLFGSLLCGIFSGWVAGRDEKNEAVGAFVGLGVGVGLCVVAFFLYFVVGLMLYTAL